MAESQPASYPPPGYVVIGVVLSERELDELRRKAAILATGTVAAALRNLAGLREEPYGIQAARLRQAREEADA